MVELPHRDKAYVPSKKVSDYLLSETHLVGKWKARFFRSVGFDEGSAEVLRQGLIRIAQSQQVAQMVSSSHGTKYVLEGPLATPSGRLVRVRTVWIIEPGDDQPRFVSAYPL